MAQCQNYSNKNQTKLPFLNQKLAAPVGKFSLDPPASKHRQIETNANQKQTSHHIQSFDGCWIIHQID